MIDSATYHHHGVLNFAVISPRTVTFFTVLVWNCGKTRVFALRYLYRPD